MIPAFFSDDAKFGLAEVYKGFKSMSTYGQKTILIVEKDAFTADAASGFIQRSGFNALTVNTCEAAFEIALTDEKIDLILMDIDTGSGIGGIEAAQKILAVRSVPVVFRASQPQPQILEKLRGVTHYGYIMKDSGDLILRSSIDMALDLFGARAKLEDELLERVKTEESFKLTEARYGSIIEDQNELICRYLPDGRLSFVNGAYARYYKKDHADLINKNFIPCIPEPDLSRVLKKVAEITKDSPAVAYIHRIIIGPSRETRWQSWTQHGIFSPDGRLLEYQAVGFDITESKFAEDKIKTLLAEKELMLKEVHHRIKNNMNTIAGLLLLQSYTLKEPAAVAALQDARNRVISMMVLYDKLYCSVDFHRISIREYIAPLVDEVVGNFPNKAIVKIEKYIDDFMLDAKKSSSLGIIINEVLTNIMKYAFTGRDNGKITVSARAVDGLATIVIEDDGNGIPESVDVAASRGFGLQLVDMLAKQLRGTIKIERVSGTRFVLEFATEGVSKPGAGCGPR